jgi:hypothetical protein
MLDIVNGKSFISLRIVDWFVTNYAKQYYTVYEIEGPSFEQDSTDVQRFKVYNDYKLKLKSYSKKRFDPFCRWERHTIPVDKDSVMETTLGQLNFFKWAIENRVLDYIEKHYEAIEGDMVLRNRAHSRATSSSLSSNTSCESIEEDSVEDTKGYFALARCNKTRKRREELSESACKSIKSEQVHVVVRF